MRLAGRRSAPGLLLGVGEPAIDELLYSVPGFSLVGVGHAPGFHAPVFLEDVHRGVEGGEFVDFLPGDIVFGVVVEEQVDDDLVRCFGIRFCDFCG